MQLRIRPDRLRYERQRQFMTQADLAQAAGITLSTINRIEAGAQEPRLSTVKKIADALRIGPLDLMTASSSIEIEEVDRAIAKLEKKASGLNKPGR